MKHVRIYSKELWGKKKPVYYVEFFCLSEQEAKPTYGVDHVLIVSIYGLLVSRSYERS